MTSTNVTVDQGRKKTGTILIRGARQLLTLQGPKGPRCGSALGELGLTHDGSVLIRDGHLLEVGSTRRVENLAKARDALEINAAGRVVMPGFVDSHTHLAFPPPGAAELDADAAAREIHVTSGQRLAWRLSGYLQAMARHGTTTVEVKSGGGRDERSEIKILRVLATLNRDHPLDVIATFLFRLPPPTNGGEWAPEAGRTLRELLAKVQRRRLADFADVAWEGESQRLGGLVRYLGVARELGVPCKVHADRPDAGAAIHAAVEHLASTVDHLEFASASEASLLAGSGTMATLLPCSSFQSGGAYAPVRAMIDAGVAVALASNFNPLLAPTLSMQTVVAMACLRMGMTPAEAITATTINGAHAVGCASHTGSLEPGKLADVLILDASDYRDVARCVGTNLVHMTVKRGEIVYKEGSVRSRRDASIGAT